MIYAQEVMTGSAADRQLPRLEQRAGPVARRQQYRRHALARRRLAALPDGPGNGGNVRRLTSSSAIDTEPFFSPDGRTVYFVSDRGGGPQVYRVGDRRRRRRADPRGQLQHQPAVSPDAARSPTSRARATASSSRRRLEPGSAAGHADRHHRRRGPRAFAPNGKLIIYATRAGGRDVLMTPPSTAASRRGSSPTTADVRAHLGPGRPLRRHSSFHDRQGVPEHDVEQAFPEDRPSRLWLPRCWPALSSVPLDENKGGAPVESRSNHRRGPAGRAAHLAEQGHAGRHRQDRQRGASPTCRAWCSSTSTATSSGRVPAPPSGAAPKC